MSKEIHLTAVTHYSIEDPECDCDYHSIELFDDNSPEPIAEFGDYYHDKGQDKLTGFIMGLSYLGYDVRLTQKDVADSNL